MRLKEGGELEKKKVMPHFFPRENLIRFAKKEILLTMAFLLICSNIIK